MILWKFATIANQEFHNNYFCLVLYELFFREYISKFPHDYYLKAQMTRQHVWQSKDLSGQYPILTGHCPLTSIISSPTLYIQSCFKCCPFPHNTKKKHLGERFNHHLIFVSVHMFQCLLTLGPKNRTGTGECSVNTNVSFYKFLVKLLIIFSRKCSK